MFRDLSAVLGVVAILAFGCGGGDESRDSGEEVRGPTVIATTSIWADIAANVACDDMAEVKTLIPIGGDPHGFEPSLADRADLEEAVLVVANGVGLEEGLADTLDAVEESGTTVFRVAESLATGDDPHVWLDPTLVVGALPALGEHLIAAGLDAESVEACIAAYEVELADLDEETVSILSTVPNGSRKLITNHDALGYFAERYDFEVVGTVIPVASGLAETSPAQLEKLAQIIEDTGVRAIFAEEQHSTDDAEALADQVGEVAVVTLFTGSLGSAGGDADTYIGLLRANATLVAEALS